MNLKLVSLNVKNVQFSCKDVKPAPVNQIVQTVLMMKPKMKSLNVLVSTE